MKINNLVEQIFSQAVALEQNGGLRNSIYAIGREIYIMNYDHTVLLRFRLRETEGAFEHPISFRANDYDSSEFEQKDGRIVFFSKKGEYERKKTCGTSDLTPEEVRELFKKYVKTEHPRINSDLTQDVLELLDDELSHVEFSGTSEGSIKLIQRNIYSGGIVEVTKNGEGFFTEKLEGEFGPVAIKTDDLKALFYFQPTLLFQFPAKGVEGEDYLIVKGGNDLRRNFVGVIALCLYDEIINIKTSKNGREK